MVVHNFNVDWAIRRPAEANAPLIVDPNAELPLAVAFQSLQPIARRRSQVCQPNCGIELVELTQSHSLERPPPRRTQVLAKQALGSCVGEAPDHAIICDTSHVPATVFAQELTENLSQFIALLTGFA